MVPALAALARHVVRVNGLAETIHVVEGKSLDLSAEQLGGAADLLVCEIVDDALLGEGVLATVSDARERLLCPGAAIIPQSATVYAVGVSLRPPERCGLRLEDVHGMACDHLLSPSPAGARLHYLVDAPEAASASEKHATVLTGPIELFQIDFTNPRGSNERVRCLEACADASGVLDAFAIHFRLHLGATSFSTGLDNPRLVAWEQAVNHLPMHVRVSRGETLAIWASHTHEEVCVGMHNVPREAVVSDIGYAGGLCATEDERWAVDLICGAEGDQTQSQGITEAILRKKCYALAPFAPVDVCA